jgi:uroporphyrin-3 C-methyltransferase
MSKQEHGQDEKRALSGADKKTSGDTAATPSKEDKPSPGSGPASRDEAGKPGAADKSSQGTTPPASSPPSGKPASKPAQNQTSGRMKGKGNNGAGASPAKPQGAAGAGSPDKKGDRPQDSRPQDKKTGSAPSSSTPPPGTGNAGNGARPPGGGGGGSKGGSSGGKSPAGIIALALALLLLVAVAGGGWWLWQQLDQQQSRLAQLSHSRQAPQVEPRVEDNAEAIDQLDSRLGQLDSRLGQIDSRLVELSSQLDDRGQQRSQAVQALQSDMQELQDRLDQRLDSVMQSLAEQQQADPGEWTFAEIEYLLRIANQRLQLERDVSGARALLETADERLSGIDNPALTPVRRAIQSELGELGSVPDVDRTGLYLSLMSLQSQLAKLPLEQDIQQIAAQGNDTSTVEGGWQQQLSRFGQELKELVVVRKHDQALEALMSPQQESYLRQNVRLQLEQAQLAVLQAKPELYQASLEKATTLVKNYYDTDSESVTQALDKLESLTGRTIRPELPDISDSLQELRDFMARRQDGGGNDA